MPGRNRIFISYSRKDKAIYQKVKQRLLDAGLREQISDDNDIRPSDLWDPKIQAMMASAAVAVVILSDNYFSVGTEDDGYIRTKELPYLLQQHENDNMDLLLLYWSPSTYFRPERPNKNKPFNGYDLQQIQAFRCGNGRLASASEQDVLDALLALVDEAEKRLEERRAVDPDSDPGPGRGRYRLSIELILDSTGVQRVFKSRNLAYSAPPVRVVQSEISELQRLSSASLPSQDMQLQTGETLYRFLFGPDRDGLFVKIAQKLWGLERGTQANTLSLDLHIRCDDMDADPWPLNLPWHLCAFRGEPLVDRWCFEVMPAGLSDRHAVSLSPEPPILLYFDQRAEAAPVHAGRLKHFLDTTYAFAAEAGHYRDFAHIRDRLGQNPEPEILYIYATSGLDLHALATVLAGRVQLLVLNLVGEGTPVPPVDLVCNRKLVLNVHPGAAAEQARNAGYRWLQGYLRGDGGDHRASAVHAFGAGVRLWSGCGDLHADFAGQHGDAFRRSLIKLLLDRVSARREISDEMATALKQGMAVLGLVAVGTGDNRPDLLPPQAWHHYDHMREETSKDTIRRIELHQAEIPDADELLYQLAMQLEVDREHWEDGLDACVGELDLGERIIVALEWPVPTPLAEDDRDNWRTDWLEAWFRLGTETLARYDKSGVLIVNMLVVQVADEAEAEAWTCQARDIYRAGRGSLAGNLRRRRFIHHHMKPLSQVPMDDIERFLDVHYQLQESHPDLDPLCVAEWVHETTGGVFSKTVAMVEDLHDNGFQAAYAASVNSAGQGAKT